MVLRNLLPHDLAVAYLIVEWIIRIAMLVVVPARRSPQASQAWLLLIFFLPIPGLLLYGLIGRPHFPAWRHQRFLDFKPFMDGLAHELDAFRPDPDPDPETTALVRRVGGIPPVAGNRIELIPGYDEAIDRMVADVDAAQHHVRIATYIFADDETGRKVIDALGRAVRRGVSCHVLIDALGSRKWLPRTLPLLKSQGVTARKALPFRLVRRTRRDMRNHRKLFLVDGRIGYSGSQNIIRRDFKPGVVNEEMVVRIAGPAVAAMTGVFLTDWYLETEQRLEPVEPPARCADADGIAQLLPSGADFPVTGFETVLISKLHQARHKVVLTTPYLIPDEDLLGALRTAALRAVRVDIILSAVVDQKLVGLAQRSFYGELLAAGIHIHHYRDHLLHAKNLTVDDGLAVIGSSNADVRSFQLNEEVSVLLYDRTSIAAVQEAQICHLEGSDEVTADTWRARPRAHIVLERMARLVSPLL